MKRRGFIQALFGAPAAVAAGVAVAKAESQFPKGLIKETEPAQVEARRAQQYSNMTSTLAMADCDWLESGVICDLPTSIKPIKRF